ncbi:MAG TPA: MauE/DoxX family redox-associated membrane protein [Candidatus Binatia bacterium]|nr:MauE/DoxX family redox-associated membrane protein [Candidatus Binatia bacterium]
MIDPVVAAALRAGLALLFASAAVHKLRAPSAFRSALADYRLVPEPLVSGAAWGAIALECASAVALVAPGAYAAGPLLAAALLGLYGAAIAVNLARGRRDLDCGCLGPGRRQSIGWALVARNALLALAALACLAPLRSRPLVWLDGLTIVAAVAAGALLQGAAERLLAQGPALARLRDGA